MRTMSSCVIGQPRDPLRDSRQDAHGVGNAGPSFVVADWAACTPTIRSRAQWAAWIKGEPIAPAPAISLPPILRRRISTIGQLAYAAGHGIRDASKARYIFASRHGEFGRTLSLLESIDHGEGVSPADFSLSVHNALMGLLSIWARNAHGHTTLASGTDSFACALIEAAAMLADDQTTPVLLVYYDEPLPEPYDVFNAPGDETLALALLLDAANETSPTSLVIEPPADDSTVSPAQAFIRRLLLDEEQGATCAYRLSWQARRVAA